MSTPLAEETCAYQNCAAMALYGIYTLVRQSPLPPVAMISTQVKLLWCKDHASFEAKRRNALAKPPAAPRQVPKAPETAQQFARHTWLLAHALETNDGTLAADGSVLWFLEIPIWRQPGQTICDAIDAAIAEDTPQ